MSSINPSDETPSTVVEPLQTSTVTLTTEMPSSSLFSMPTNFVQEEGENETGDVDGEDVDGEIEDGFNTVDGEEETINSDIESGSEDFDADELVEDGTQRSNIISTFTFANSMGYDAATLADSDLLASLRIEEAYTTMSQGLVNIFASDLGLEASVVDVGFTSLFSTQCPSTTPTGWACSMVIAFTTVEFASVSVQNEPFLEQVQDELESELKTGGFNCFLDAVYPDAGIQIVSGAACPNSDGDEDTPPQDGFQLDPEGFGDHLDDLLQRGLKYSAVRQYPNGGNCWTTTDSSSLKQSQSTQGGANPQNQGPTPMTF